MSLGKGHMSLTTLKTFRDWIGSTDTGGDAKLEALIGVASNAILKRLRLDRTLALTTYRRWLDGNGCNTMLLPEWPVVRLYGAAVGGLDVLTLTCSGVEYASVEATPTGLSLMSVASGVETETILPFATYLTLTGIAVAVNAISGWTASVAANNELDSTIGLRPVCGQCVSPDTVTLEIPDSPTSLVEMARDTDRTIRRRGWGLGVGNNVIAGPGFPKGSSNVWVWWKAGYTEPADNAQHSSVETAGNLPAEITHVTNVMVKSLSEQADQEAGPATRESVAGEYSYALTDRSRALLDLILEEYGAILNPHRRLV